MREMIAVEAKTNIGMTEVKLRGQGREAHTMRQTATEGGNPIANHPEIITEKSAEDTVLIGELQVC